MDRALDPASNELSAAIGALDAVHCGTTTVIDHHASPNAIDGSLDRIETGLLMNYLTENPRPALIGLSLTGNTVILLSRELRTVATREELQAIIMDQLRKQR